MRRELCIITLLGLTGCCTHVHESPTTQQAVTHELEPQYIDAEADALVFAPPIAPADGELDLSREPREATAFLGYEDLIREYIYVRTDDRWSGDGRNDNYERRAISEKIGTLTR